MKKSILILFLIISASAIAQKNNIDTLTYKYTVDSIYSSNLQDYRIINIYLPKDYSKDQKYPVIYTLDANWMFYPTMLETAVLTDFGVIPNSIVVGIHEKFRNKDLGFNWDTGEFNESGSKFYNYITRELVPKINSRYSTSGFNVLIGHSDGATFCGKVLTQKDQPFRGFIALSQRYVGNQMKEFINFTQQPHKKSIFYFVASGKRDATSRLHTGMKLDSLFALNQNSNLIFRQVLYDANHQGVAGEGLHNGISFVFSKYDHLSDWNQNLIDSLINHKVKPLEFLKQYAKKIKSIYGTFHVTRNDLGTIKLAVKNDKQLERIQKFEIEHLGIQNTFYGSYAQDYERLGSYEKALTSWEKNLEVGYSDNFFYFRRPIQLLYKKMNQPKRAIEFAQKWKKKKTKFSSRFDWWIAKVALESNVKRKTGLKAIQRYIAHYTDDLPERLEDAKEIELKLKN